MPCATRPLPLPTCPDCVLPRRGDNPRCNCGYTWPRPASPLTLSEWTCTTGLRGVAQARRSLYLARLARRLGDERERSLDAA